MDSPPVRRRLRSLLAFTTILVLAAGLGYLLVFRGSAGAIPARALEGHNLLVVTIDTLRADRLGSYGSSSDLTPHLDRLASEGILFENVQAQVPLTLPSHASLFTAKYPTSHGVHDNGTFRLGEEHETLAALLKVEGYRTAAFVGAFVLDARFGLARGFDHYDDYYGEKRTFESFVELERRAEAVLSPAARWLEERREEPWLTWVHLFDPHAPYDAPEPFRSRFAEDAYGAEVAYADAALGSFFDRLEARGLLERTLVVVASDHGESLGEHGERTHGTFAYDATLRVPWILWSKHLEPGRFSPRVRLVDALPTVLDLLGVDPPRDIEGKSLRPFLHRPADYEPETSYFEALNPHLTRDWAPLRGVVRGRYKFIDLPIPELYDLESDPGEERNLARERAGTAAELSRVLEAMTAGATPLEADRVDRDTLERLASLGYLVEPTSGERKSSYTEADDPKRLISLANAHDEAGTLFQQGRTEEAVALLTELLEKQPRSSFAHQKLAYALHQLGRTQDAVRVLEEGVEQGVTDLSLLALLGSYLIESGDVTKAKELLEPLASAHPDFAEGHNYLGVAYARSGRADEAERAFSRVLELDPSSASAYNNLGSLELSRGNVGQAVAHFERALELDPRLASAHNGLGVAHAREDDLEAAIRSWKRAVELNPQQLDALFNVALALFERSPEEARPYLERFARDAPPEYYRKDIETVRSLLSQLGRSSY